MKETNSTQGIQTLDMKLLKNSVLFRLKISCMGNERKFKLPPDAIKAISGRESALSNLPQDATDDQVAEATRLAEAAKRLRGSQKLIASPEFDAVASFLATFGARIKDRYVNPSFIDDGIYSVRREVLPEIIAEIKLAEEELTRRLVPELVKAYAAEVAEAKRVLNGAFNPAFYPEPEALPSKFGIEYRITQLGIPEGLPPEIREQEEAKLKKQFEEAATEINEALYQGFSNMVDKMVDRLTPTADGKKKTFQYTSIENMLDFIAAFRAKNVFDDERLADMVSKAQDILDTVGQKPKDMAERIRSYDSLRDRIKGEFETLKEAVDKTIQELPTRNIDFSDFGGETSEAK